MLISNSKIDPGDIVSFKMQSGEEVVGKLVSQDMMSVVINKPLMLAMTKNGPAMAPIMMTINPDADLTFNKSCIAVNPVLTDKDIAGQYTFQTTGIQTVTPGNIVTG